MVKRKEEVTVGQMTKERESTEKGCTGGMDDQVTDIKNGKIIVHASTHCQNTGLICIWFVWFPHRGSYGEGNTQANGHVRMQGYINRFLFNLTMSIMLLMCAIQSFKI